MRTENKGKERVYAIRRKIAENRGLNDFPKPEDFSITEDEVDDFLYEMMGGPQSIEEQKKIYTKYGICFILPIGIIALMKQSMANFLIGVASGLILCAIYYLIHKFIRQRKLNKLLQSGVKEYIDAVERY